MSSQPQKSTPVVKQDSTFGMVIVLGMIGATAGFTMYTKRTGTMLRQMDQISKNKARRMPARSVGPMTKAEWDKARPRFDKDEFI
jgi:hypothetical protein